MRAISILLTTFAVLLSLAAQAQTERNRYKWKDSEGNLHYDDALPTAAIQFGYDVVNKNGMVVKHVDPPKTPEQIEAEKQAAAKAASEKRAEEEQAQRDQQVLAAYPTEQDLARAQQGQLDSLDQEAHATEVSLASQEKSLTDMLGRAADLERTGKPVPPSLSKQIETQRAVVAKQKDYIVGKQKEHVEMVKRFADDLARYRELHARLSAKAKP